MSRVQQAVAFITVYSMVLGLCYQAVYWAQFGVNPIEYLSFSDLAKMSIISLAAGSLAIVSGVIICELLPLSFLKVSIISKLSKRLPGDCVLYDVLKVVCIFLLFVIVMQPGGCKYIILALVIPPVACAYVRNIDMFVDAVPGSVSRSIVVYCLCALPFVSFQRGNHDAMAVIEGKDGLYKEADGGYVKFVGKLSEYMVYSSLSNDRIFFDKLGDGVTLLRGLDPSSAAADQEKK